MNSKPNEDGRPDVSLLLDASSVTVYMTRTALEDLAAELIRISKADPKECYEVHVGMHFSRFDSNDNHMQPAVKFGDGLGKIISKMGNDRLNESIASGAIDADYSLSPFEVTIMHVSPEMVQEVAMWPDD
ncbi:MAG: hypothetical protein ABJB10_09285 [Mesorhizobium sp.]